MSAAPNTLPKLPVTFENERLKFQNDDKGNCAINTIVNNTVKVDINESGEFINGYFEVSAVAANANVNIINYTVPVGKKLELKQIDFGGDNIAIFKAFLDSNTISQKRTWYGNFDGFIGWRDYTINSGVALILTVENCGDSTVTFYGNFQGRLIDE